MATFSNIIPPTRLIPPVEEQGKLWQLLSRLHLSLSQAFSPATFKEFLSSYALSGDTDPGRRVINQKKLDAIGAISLASEDFLSKGHPIRGTRVSVELESDAFASLGDALLFGEALERFLAVFHQINTFTRLVFIERNSRETFQWNPRLGTRRLV
jgi:type VI secretion system protein ImpG